jgi:hypothetical protein
MVSTRTRMIVLGVVVCLFAVSMATFLNYFKYRSTADRIVKGRLVVIGKSIENSIQSSLAVGLSFADLETLPGLMERERTTDELILGIKVFDVTGKPLYATDRLRAQRPVPTSWIEAARRAGDTDWHVDSGPESAVGISIKNNFGLTVGYLALRYSRDKIDAAAQNVGRELAFAALGIFLVSAVLASLALVIVMRRIDRDIRAVEDALVKPGKEILTTLAKSPFEPTIKAFFASVWKAEAQIAAVRGRLASGSER